MIEDLASAAANLLAPMPLAMLCTGVLIGTIMGILPGLGPTVAIALAVPFTLGMPLAPSIALLMGLYCASIYGGAIAAVLLNVPGTPASAATCLDGHTMARRGDGDLAIGLATVASAGGGIISLLVLAVLAPFLAQFALRFGPLEMSLVGLFALCCVAVIERRTLVRALAAGFIGIALASVGQDPATGSMRLTFGYFPLTAGIPLVPLLIGLFAISEVMLRVAEIGKGEPRPDLARVGFRLPHLSYWKHGGRLLFKSSLLGTGIGVLPGAGPTAASFISYAEAKRSSKTPERFGKGEPDGVVASESANNSVTGGALVPSLSLGIPGDPITAIILSALVLQGVIPGPRLYSENYDIVLTVLMALLLANIGMFVLGAAGAHLWTRILRVPEPILLAGVVVLAVIGTFAVNNSFFDIYILVVAGLLGWTLRTLGFPLAPLIIGFVLGPMVEFNFRQALVVYQGNWLVFFDRPIAGALFLMTVAVLAFPLIERAMRGLIGQRAPERR